MARDRELEERDYYEEQRRRREPPWRNDERDVRSGRSLGDYDRGDYGRGRFAERANYERSEPRYGGYSRFRENDDYGYSRPRDVEYSRQRFGEPERFRSRLRARDIMTRDLAIAVRDNTLYQVAKMMKNEDTGVIPVVEYEAKGNGGQVTEEPRGDGERRLNHYGKLVGLITDRDIVMRAVAEGRDCGSVRAADIMSTSIETAKPTDRLIDVLRREANKCGASPSSERMATCWA